jgi:16S rRNA (cytidine1402-2'-O)-methyltransferase
MSLFSVVSTPIGNLQDITLRALEVLGKAHVILCEDTRVTKRLLLKHGITTKTLSYHAHSKIGRVDEIVDLLDSGNDVALVSDAGTPAISDPGAELVKIIRDRLVSKIQSGEIKIESIPGPSALTGALSIAGINCNSFTFLGFLPHKKGRETLFKEISESKYTVVFYESPHRIMKTLDSLAQYLASDRTIAVCRELTKIFEQVVRGKATDVKDYFESNPDKVKGEFVVVVSGQF